MRKTISLALAVLMMLVLIPFGKLNSAVAEEATKTYTLVTSADDLTAGGTYLMASAGDPGTAYALGVQKNNNRDEGVLRQAEKIGQSLYVGVVLLDRIAEMVSIAVHVLRPLVRCFVTVYPACVISSL